MSAPTDRDDLLAFLGWQRPAWQRDAACKEHPDLTWFPEHGVSFRRQQAICDNCLVNAECRAAAFDAAEVGIWGGTTGRERIRIRVAAAKLAA